MEPLFDPSLFDHPPAGSTDVDSLVRAQLSDYLGSLEQACEAALASGTLGVRVTWRGTEWTIETTLEVPWGTIEEVRA